jgi:hypothetical protein
MSKYIVKRTKWNTEAALCLESALSHDARLDVDNVAFDVQSGDLGLFEVVEETQSLGFFVIRLEEHPKQDELVIVLAAGKTPEEGSFLDLVTQNCKEIAKAWGCDSVRAHTHTQAHAKIFERTGAKLSEYVYRLEIA